MSNERDMSYISRKMRVLSLFAAFAIVFIHSGCLAGLEHQSVWCQQLVDICTQKMTCWAVPLFFCMAGYWFAVGRYDGYIPFLKKKFRSLVIPYLCFACIALVVSTPVVVAANIAAHRALLSNTVAASGEIWTTLNNIFAFTIVEPKQLGVLWFIRTLFFLFLLAPLYQIIVRKCPILFLAFFIIMEIFCPGCDIPHFPIWFGAALWLYLGMFLGAWGRGTLLRRVGCPWPVAVMMLAAAITTSFLRFPCSAFVAKLLFIVGIWYLYDTIECHLPEKLPQVFYWSFWIYCTHNIFMTYVLAGLRFAFGKSDMVIACLPFVATPVVLSCCILVAFWLNRAYPRGFAVLCGGRA